LLAPYVAKADGGLTEEAAEELGGQDVHLVILLLTALRGRARTSPACRLALEIAATGGPDAAGALQAPLMLVLQADADLVTRLANFLSRPNTGAASLGP